MRDEQYEPLKIEKKWQKVWADQNKFEPKPSDKQFSIVIPPPNVTGSLHMGHALEHSIIDVLVRYKRLNGFETLWVPGTDHAGIITQLLVEKELSNQGTSKELLGRDKFIDEVWKWKETSGENISNQMKTLGMSCDWSMERFTMDEGLSDAVKQVFIDLYEKDLIYKGTRMVNWDTTLMSAVSDLEVNMTSKQGKLWNLRYKVGDEHLVIATTRPETLLGDSAIAVNPNDERYKNLIGKKAIIPLVNREVPIIADEYVDIEFGSGCVKITPAHDFNDYEIGIKHSLELISCMNLDGSISNDEFIPKNLRGLDRFEARKIIIQELQKLDQVEKIDDYTNQIPIGDRSKSILEPMITEQWFVKTKDIAKDAIKAVETDEIKFIPKNWEKTYFEWMYNIQDWCISRQIWWGHRIPAWYDDNGNIYVGLSEEDVRSKNNLSNEIALTQDGDVLDTWFSSALWPFSTLGWPEDTDKLKQYYPTSLLVTGFDIIFFWVARMIMMGLHVQKEVPFQHILIHGLVRDSKGRKMSKSLGNTIDPLELSVNHGADALRFSLIEKASPGQDVPFDEEWTVAAKKFGNKIWNAAKFVHLYTDDFDDLKNDEIISKENIWILTRFNQVLNEFELLFNDYKVSDAYKVFYNFLWSDLFDWYFELSKNLITNNINKDETSYVLRSVFLKSLKILNPAMPHITEEIWSSFDETLLIDNVWPDKYKVSQNDTQEVEALKNIISQIRNFKVTYGLKNSQSIEVHSSAIFEDWFIMQLEVLTKCTVQKDSDIFSREKNLVVFQHQNFKFGLVPGEYIDIEVEKKKLNKKLAELSKTLDVSKSRLDNKKFVENAKPELIQQEKKNLANVTLEIDTINETLNTLNG
ncbi:valine--tRNA ligase [Acidimicrobiia bacterium]|nr:valine--tRNA ligase [Acidimicrobiaceae bacterium]MDA8719830.1 valine--tRNA ligase [Candidatus Actinomarina sp.]MDA9036945.1 valine--tRNA ligase [Acidimicrobiia bacterium]MDB0017089.1 valine--tRNA ligase [Acidimicrobiia bacterium]|tara:strand:- start:4154 stop:6748 length:2595 start_codon:yes stop_codon:yes gene_type:complete